MINWKDYIGENILVKVDKMVEGTWGSCDNPVEIFIRETSPSGDWVKIQKVEQKEKKWVHCSDITLLEILITHQL